VVNTEQHDDVLLAHELRRLLWETWGDRAVPHMWIRDDECGLRVRGTDPHYIVTIRRDEEAPTE